MSVYEFEKQIEELVKTGKIKDAIARAQDELLKTPTNDFQKIVNRDLLHLKDDVDEFLNELCKKSIEELGVVKAMFCEMNDFTINPQMWAVTGVSFSFCNDLENPEWLADFEYAFDMILVIEGYEDLQKIYEDDLKNEKRELGDAKDLCAIIISLRLLELFKTSYELFKEKSEWAKIPVFVNSHDSEMMYRTF